MTTGPIFERREGTDNGNTLGDERLRRRRELLTDAALAGATFVLGAAHVTLYGILGGDIRNPLAPELDPDHLDRQGKWQVHTRGTLKYEGTAVREVREGPIPPPPSPPGGGSYPLTNYQPYKYPEKRVHCYVFTVSNRTGRSLEVRSEVELPKELCTGQEIRIQAMLIRDSKTGAPYLTKVHLIGEK